MSTTERRDNLVATGSIHDYIAIARPDHWIKNVFMLPGIALALILDPSAVNIDIVPPVLLALVSACLLASANYTINEWLDAEFDRHHPTKKERPSASGRMRRELVYLQYALLATAGLALAWTINGLFLTFAAMLLAMGLLYNVPPVRTKDKQYLDVLSESINNPLRFILGWAAITSIALPPSSILISYWMGGAYLMAMKRYAEYRMIGDPQRAGLYRRSFRYYTETSLLVSSFFYAITSSFLLGIFLIKYRIEFLVSFPFIALLFAWYLSIAMRPASRALHPEKLFHEKRFVCYTVFLCALVLALYFIDIPGLHVLVDSHAIRSAR
ncbi:MAG TPA: UbiA prenyltransferase family protein [Burkholderiaceae bacterium]|nr:UbiA prenyltransferase family protein [Burkholderiaceae bacterium]